MSIGGAYVLERQKTIWYLTVRTGAGAYVRLFIVVKGEIVEVTKRAALVMGATYVESKGIYRKGSGLDLGYDTVENLSLAIFDDAAKLSGRRI